MSKRPTDIRCISEASKSSSRQDADRIFQEASGSGPIGGERDACNGAGKGRRAERGGNPAHARGDGGVPEVQRSAGQGGNRSREWPPLPELPGQASSVRGQAS